MVIQCDTRQKMHQKHHQTKEKWFVENGHTVLHSKCLVGDYVCPSNGSVAVDTKQNCSELYSDLIQDHDRFRSECILARDCGIQLYILVENNEGFKEPKDIIRWKNPQMFRYYKARKLADKNHTKPPKPPASNAQLIKIMHSMNRDYGVKFLFCKMEDAGRIVVELLGGVEDAS